MLINLFVYNDVARSWLPQEQTNLNLIEFGAMDNLPLIFWNWWADIVEGKLLFLRLPSFVILLLGLGSWYWLAPSIFGKRSALDTLIVMSSSLIILLSGKLIVADVWLFSIQLINFLALIRYIKQSQSKWLLLYWISALLGALTHPLLMGIWILVLAGFLRVLLPGSKEKAGIKVFWTIPAILLLAIIGKVAWDGPGFALSSISFSYWLFLGLMILTMIPWIGFLAGGMRDLWYKLKRGEELAAIILAWLAAGLFSQSLIVQAAFAFMIAKQVSLYFSPNYPHQNLVKGFTVLHLIFAFLGVSMLLLSAFAHFEARGFRSAIAVGAIYWMMSFIAVIGLYGNRRRLIFGGMAWSMALAFLLFWLLMSPLLGL